MGPGSLARPPDAPGGAIWGLVLGSLALVVGVLLLWSKLLPQELFTEDVAALASSSARPHR